MKDNTQIPPKNDHEHKGSEHPVLDKIKDTLEEFFVGKHQNTDAEKIPDALGQPAAVLPEEVKEEVKAAEKPVEGIDAAQVPKQAIPEEKPTEEKKLTLEEIEALKKAEAGGEAGGSHHAPDAIVHSHFGDVDSLPRNLGIDNTPPVVEPIVWPILPEEPVAVRPDHPVEILDLTPAIEGGDAVVYEEGLLAGRGGNPTESAGSHAGNGSTVDDTGNFRIVTPDGVNNLTVGGVFVFSAGVFIPGSGGITSEGNKITFTSYVPDDPGHPEAGGVIHYTYELLDNENHPTDNGKNSLFENFDVVLTDTDGSSADATLSVRIVDDVPSITVAPCDTCGEGRCQIQGGEEGVGLLSNNSDFIQQPPTCPVLLVDESFLHTDAHGFFSNSFLPVPGADGQASLTYTLGIPVDGKDSGLVDTLSHQHVLLFLEASTGDVVGKTALGNSEVFRISLDKATGEVTLDQSSALVHSDPSQANETVQLAANLVNITAILTDNDGDVATAQKEIGDAFRFADDVPTITVCAVGEAPQLVVDETDLSVDKTLNFSSNFQVTSNFGADGPGAITGTYALSVSSPGVPSGLIDVATEQPVLLFLNNVTGVVEGRITDASGALVFTLTVDNSPAHMGDVTLNQIRALAHPDATLPDDTVQLSDSSLIKLTYSAGITDGDADHANSAASLNIGKSLVFHDDAPMANDDCYIVNSPALPAYDLTFVLDISGSMSTVVDGTHTRLQILKEALVGAGNLLDSYAAASSALHINIVTFSTGATVYSPFTDIAAAKTLINSLSPGGTTHYLDAIHTTESSIINNIDPTDGFIQRLYFLSDGIPNPVAGQSVVGSDATTWQNDLNSKGVNAYILSIGETDDTYLHPLDNNQSDAVIHVNNDLSNLAQILVDTVSHTETDGKVLTNDNAGADQGAHVINVYFDVGSQQDANNYLAAHPSLVGATADANGVVTIPIPNGDIVTPLGNTLHMNTDGTFAYTSLNNNTAADENDEMFYTMADKDNDPAHAELCFNIDGTVTITQINNAVVNEAGLSAGRGPLESDGTHHGDGSNVGQGSFVIKSADGVDDLIVAGHAVISGGNFNAGPFTTPLGNTIDFTSYDAGSGIVSYTYILTDNEIHQPNANNGTNNLFEDLPVTLTEMDGDTVNNTLSIRIIDDVPKAVDDSNGVATGQHKVLTGNVLDNDIQGADGASVDAFSKNGTFGKIVVDALGNYTYTLDTNDHDFTILNGIGHENFSYTLRDADGDTDVANIKLDVQNNPAIITKPPAQAGGGDAVVNEADLPNGSHTVKGPTTVPGTFTISAVDGVASLIVGSTSIITNGTYNPNVNITTILGNVLHITGYDPNTGIVSYTYELTGHDIHPAVQGTNSVSESLDISLTDTDGSHASSSLSLRVIDDVPTAVDDSNAQTATSLNQILHGNALNNDTQGADGASILGFTKMGKYGSITVAPDGSYTYTLLINPNDPNNAFKNLSGPGSESFSYTLKDTDGDTSTANINLNVQNNGVSITDLTPKASGGDASVNEADLSSSRGAGESDGSHNPKGSTTVSGTFTISAPDGVASLTVGGVSVVTNGSLVILPTANIATPLGNVVHITGYDANTGIVSYTYELKDNEIHPSGSGTNTSSNPLFDDLNVNLTDTDGSNTSKTLSIKIIDDVPKAVDDAYSALKPALPSYNIELTLDISGSMNTVVPNSGGKTRIEILKESLVNPGALLDSYVAASTHLNITIVTFSTNASAPHTFALDDIASVKSFILGLTPGGSTNYVAALTQAESAIANDTISGYVNKTYFISDGEPNVGIPSAADYHTWQTDIAAKNYDAIALNIATANTYLNGIANPTDNPPVINVAPDLSNLQSILVGTVPVTHTTGNILTNDTAGADGIGDLNIHFTFANNAAATAYANAHPGSSVSGNVVTFDITQNNTSIVTPLGDTLLLSPNGAFDFTPSKTVAVGAHDIFTYEITDKDFDVSNTATVNFTITAPPVVPVFLDLNGDGQTVTKVTSAQFDANADGVKDQMLGWVNPQDGILVYDYDNTHKVNSLDKIDFAIYDKNAKTDLEGLRLAFDTNHDGVFDAKDAEFSKFGVWQDKNGDGIVEKGEYHTLTEMKISAIDLNGDDQVKLVGENVIYSQTKFTYADGSTGIAQDVGLAYQSLGNANLQKDTPQDSKDHALQTHDVLCKSDDALAKLNDMHKDDKSLNRDAGKDGKGDSPAANNAAQDCHNKPADDASNKASSSVAKGAPASHDINAVPHHHSDPSVQSAISHPHIVPTHHE